MNGMQVFMMLFGAIVLALFVCLLLAVMLEGKERGEDNEG